MKLNRRAWLCALALALPAGAHHQRSQHANRAAKGWPLAAFELRDHQGAPLTLARLQGHWTFLVLGDTRCAEPCTQVLAALAALRERVARTQALASLQVVFLALDPGHDSAERLRDYLAPFDASFIGASGDASALQRLVDDLALVRDASRPATDHRGALVLVGPDAVLRVEYLPPYDPKLLAADFLTVRARR